MSEKNIEEKKETKVEEPELTPEEKKKFEEFKKIHEEFNAKPKTKVIDMFCANLPEDQAAAMLKLPLTKCELEELLLSLCKTRKVKKEE